MPETSQLIPFPSEGIPYQGTSLGEELIDGTSVIIRAYNAEDQHMLSTDVRDVYQFYRTILSRLVTKPVLKTFDPILLGDAIGIVVAIKLFVFGPKYDILSQCQNELCNLKFMAPTSVDEDFHMRTASDLIEEFGVFQTSEIEMKLTNELSGVEHTLLMHLPTIEDEKKVTGLINNAKAKKKLVADSDAERARYRLAQFIDSIDGTKESLIDKKLKFLGQLHVDGPEQISKFLEDRSVGFVDGMLYECPHCGFTNTVRLSITPKFFRPAARPDKAD